MKDLHTFVTLGAAAQRAVDKILETPEGKVRQEFTDLVVTTLHRKRRIDRDNAAANNMASYDRWLVDAVELLLQIELERRHQPDAGRRALEGKP